MIQPKLIVPFFFSFLSIAGGKTPDVSSRTYTQIMQEQMLKGEESEVCFRNCILHVLIERFANRENHFQLRKKIQEKSKDGSLVKSSNGDATKAAEPRKRGRWDQTIDDQFVPAKKSSGAVTPTWNDVEVSQSDLLLSYSGDYRFFVCQFAENTSNRATMG